MTSRVDAALTAAAVTGACAATAWLAHRVGAKHAARSRQRAALSSATPLNPLASALCSIDPRDSITVSYGANPTLGPLIGLTSSEGGHVNRIGLGPVAARAFAAAILNAADAADGLEPIFLVPGLADAPEAPDA